MGIDNASVKQICFVIKDFLMNQKIAIIFMKLSMGLTFFVPFASQAGEIAICVGGVDGRNLSCNRQDFIGKDIVLSQRSLGEMSHSTWRLVNVFALPPLLQKKNSPQEESQVLLYYFFEKGFSD